jgi:alanine dehydrogenase
MRIAVPTEVKNNEYRVAITPAGVHELVRHGHEVFIQAGAGLGSSYSDADYLNQGAKIVATADDAWAAGDLVLKVKEPLASEYPLLHRHLGAGMQMLHLAAAARRFVQSKVRTHRAHALG